MTAFPALARAKKLFLLRKGAAKQREEDAHEEFDYSTQIREISPSKRSVKAQNGRKTTQTKAKTATRRCTASLIAFCSDFDEQLQLLNSDLLLLNTSVRREYQRESLALENLTSKLQDRDAKWLEAPPVKKRYVKRCRIRLQRRKPRINLQVVLQQKAPAVKLPANPKTLSPAALLALQTVKACAIQSSNRRYLYHCLYRGGRSQLVAASQLATRCRCSRAFRHWRRIAAQRLKLRLRCHRAQQRIESCRSSFARSRAFQVVEAEGKYGMAKEFQQSKVLASSFHAWLGWYQNAFLVQR
ncbi:hypothetical protein V7S43_015147 [Phytophthora oleae]|uniref:Uncharacterized protein n=1 Tax=Phytophthora oleae TaxID=2107226 RepID=A0ABD3F370_9STRA